MNDLQLPTKYFRLKYQFKRKQNAELTNKVSRIVVLPLPGSAQCNGLV